MERVRNSFFIFGLGVFLLLALSFGMVAPVQAEIQLNYASFPPAQTFPGVQLERWKLEVEKRTKKQVKVNAYHGGTLLGARNLYDGVVSGAADIGTFPLGYHLGRFPLVEMFGTYVGWPSAEAASSVLADLFDKYDFESLKDVRVLTVFTITPAHIMSMKAIRNRKDLEGYELRGSGTITKALELLGAKPIGMPMSEVPDALKKGVVKGLVTSVEVMKDFNFAEYCPFVTMTYMPVAPWVVFMNKKTWNSLPSDVQEVIEGLSRDHALWTGRYNDNHEKEALEWSKEKYNVEIITLASDELAEWHRLLGPLSEPYMDITEGGISGKEFWAQMLKFKEAYLKGKGK
jgi:TRAP-type C4-dicarboxylate transport system substrate-binding protein